MLDMLWLGLIALPVGFLGSLIGLGGAAMIIPLLVLAGVPVKEAIASAMVTIIATSSGSASSYVRQRIANIKIAMFLEMFTITGAIAGAIITTKISPVYLYFFFAAFLMTSFLKLREPKDGYVTPVKQDRVSRWLELHGSYYDEAHDKLLEYKVNNALWGGAGMLVAGVAAGMLGIGAGAFKVTVQENVLRMPPKVASTTSNFIIGMTALAGTSIYLFSGLLNLTLMAPVAVGATIGAIIGGRILNKISNSVLRVLFLVVVFLMISQMLYKGISAL
ncbi:MAG: sulfite exporter TauE/SafE family protein [Dehalococcoidales bacterium]|jgi:uncharacterized membrane protein YfcA